MKKDKDSGAECFNNLNYNSENYPIICDPTVQSYVQTLAWLHHLMQVFQPDEESGII